MQVRGGQALIELTPGSEFGGNATWGVALRGVGASPWDNRVQGCVLRRIVYYFSLGRNRYREDWLRTSRLTEVKISCDCT